LELGLPRPWEACNLELFLMELTNAYL